MALSPPDYRYDLALAMLEYNRADFPRAVVYASQTLKRAYALSKDPQRGQVSLARVNAYERQRQYQQAEEDFWRAVWSGNNKAGGYYGLVRLTVRNSNFGTGLDFYQ